MKCKFCKNDILPVERVTEAGYDYCKSDDCVAKGIQINVVQILVPKQGETVVFKNSSYLKHGKSSGRT